MAPILAALLLLTLELGAGRSQSPVHPRGCRIDPVLPWFGIDFAATSRPMRGQISEMEVKEIVLS